ncbi:TIGR02611 family protein [Geodermatophilus sp. DSM 44513]|uniref:TIGR02611 family protein n=1 Tax=Geodermatophilus sp. DSM 44513 TaxID=1528104 RepID=UPI00127FBDDF|nr:TIGR02611 family protein [Geodermatophilus sp. DSM 44513]WNV77427.1 TIGR02611 family protein [Geodermatophilus sp. DSM 44513]
MARPERERPGHPAPSPRRPHAEDGHRSLRERVGHTRWRRWLGARRPLEHTYRLVLGVVGGLVVAVGLVTIPLPGPGWLTVIAGLFLLSTEFAWAERLLDYTRRRVRAWTEWLGRQPAWVRVAVALATAAFVYGALVVVLHLTGVPDWVPGWVPLWR